MHSDANNLYGWTMSQKLPINGFKWKKIYQSLIKSLYKTIMKNATKYYY